jgi:hypothetical protein
MGGGRNRLDRDGGETQRDGGETADGAAMDGR